MPTHSIDGKLTQIMAGQEVTPEVPVANAPEPVVETITTAQEAPKINAAENSDPYNQPESNDTDQPEQNNSQPSNEQQKEIEKPQDDNAIDEYGNPIAKQKLYSEEEVERLMREKFIESRLALKQQRLQQKTEIDQPQQPQQENGEDWEQELGKFIDKRLEQKQKEVENERWQEQEIRRQSEFEAKFTNGMNKYSDFHKVVSGKPITDTMMLAARNLDNPAAFIYNACKAYPGEVESISKMNDAYAQAAAIGRLHEKMVKSKIATSSPRPLEIPKGDMPPAQIKQPSLEERIDQYAKQKRK